MPVVLYVSDTLGTWRSWQYYQPQMLRTWLSMNLPNGRQFPQSRGRATIMFHVCPYIRICDLLWENQTSPVQYQKIK